MSSQFVDQITKEAIHAGVVRTVEIIHQSLEQVVLAARLFEEETTHRFIEEAALMVVETFKSGNKLLIAGNGGSLCDSIHMAEEFTGQFRKKRLALPAIALADVGHMSCVGNDMGFDQVFSRAVEAHGRRGDTLIIFTTSGNSANLVKAVETGKKLGLKTIGFLGRGGGLLKNQTDAEWCVDGFEFSDRVQEAHMAAAHLVIELVERLLFDVT